jgi:cobalt-zinc-cadmium efflux system outer membrane protein
METFFACARRACLLVISFLAAASAIAASGPPLTLQQAISAAMQGDPRLQTFAFRFRAEDARAQQAALRPAPQISANLENVAGTGDTQGLDAAEGTLALSKVIELGGKQSARISATQASRDVLAIERDAAQLDVLAEVTRRFIIVAQRQQELELLQEAVELAKRTVSAAERRVHAARSPHAELDRAGIAHGRAVLEARGAQFELDTARSQLAATWGESAPVINGQPFGKVEAKLFDLPDAGEFPDLVAGLVGNPDLLIFATEARLRDAELRLAESRRRPDVEFGAGLRHLEETNDQAFVLSLAMPLYSARRASGFEAEARANRELVDAERRVAETRVRTTLYELHQHLAQAILVARTLTDDIQPRAAEALEETRRAFDRGRYGYLDLVDAQREYLSVRASLIEASANAQLLRTEIERLTNMPLSGAAQ